MAYLRAKGVQCYGIGPMTDEEDAGQRLLHAPTATMGNAFLKEGLYKFVQFNWEVRRRRL